MADPFFVTVANNNTISCSRETLPKEVQAGSIIKLANGRLTCTVKCVIDKSVICECQNDFVLGEKEVIHLPDATIDRPALSAKDLHDISEFGLKYNVDYVAAAVRKGADVSEIRREFNEEGKDIKVFAKIESREAIKNFDEILAEADGIMVARNNLAIEVPLNEVYIAQMSMIKKANDAGKPIMTAMQMFDSLEGVT